LQDLDLVIAPHNGRLESGWIDELQAAGLDAGTYKNLRSVYGDCAVADLLIDLAEFGAKGSIPRNSVVALWAPCVGVQLAVLVLRWL
jgi:hypothetical protein